MKGVYSLDFVSSSLASTQPGPGHGLDIGDRFTSCSTEKQIHLCQLGMDRTIKFFHSHTNKASAIKWDSQGKFLFSSSDGTEGMDHGQRKMCSRPQGSPEGDLHD